jgi:SAM-dependent methyltransferase
MNEIIRKTHCRAGGGELIDLLNLGEIHLNGFPLPDEPDPPKFPLVLAIGEYSGLLQLRHTLNPELMYLNYWYESATNESMVAHLKHVANSVYDYVDLGEDDEILDIGCNDGTLLNNFNTDYDVVGVDPSNVEPGHWVDEFHNDFFSADMFSNRKFKAIFSIAMFYDLDDPVDFSRQVASILEEDGVWVIEMHYAPKMLEMNDIGAICHEHLCYYSFETLRFVLDQADLYICDAKMNEVNGGSIRVYVKHVPHNDTRYGLSYIPPDPMDSRVDVFNLIQKERSAIDFDSFVDNVFRNKEEMITLLDTFKDENRPTLGYGASTKGNTVLQYHSIGRPELPYIADRNPRKWGRVTPGTRIPIISEEEARAMNPKYFFALPYHFIESFIAREIDFINRGGLFMVPFPQPGVVVDWD